MLGVRSRPSDWCVIIIIIIIIIIIVIIIYDNDHIQRHNSRFFTICSLRREVSNTYAQVARAHTCANHVQHIERLSRAACRVTCHVVLRAAQLLNLTEFEIYLSFILLAGPLNR